MKHRKRRDKKRLDNKVAVRGRVQAVHGDAGKAELLGQPRAVHGKRRPSQRPGAERQLVRTAPAILEARNVPSNHLEVSQPIVREQNGLSGLEVGKAGNHNAQVPARPAGE